MCFLACTGSSPAGRLDHPGPAAPALAAEVLVTASTASLAESGDAGIPELPTRTPAQVEARLKELFRGDLKAEIAAFDLFRTNGVAVDVERESDFDGGYRGTVHIVPAVPVGRERFHLEWVDLGLTTFNGLVSDLKSRSEHPAHFSYRAVPDEIHFFRSVGRSTPSAYAADWTIAYNLAGSLHRSPEAVYETLVHEVFHLNDQAHGEWSLAHLTSLHQRILSRCGSNSSCLAPYAPNDTRVRGGTYYSFQPGNDVQEYAAELAVRFFREQSRALTGAPISHRFKCGKPENAESWKQLSDEFFGGLDLVPPC